MLGPDQWKFVPVIVRLAVRTRFSRKRSLAADLNEFHIFQWTELVPTLGQGPFPSQISVNNVYCLCQSESTLSLFPNPAWSLIVTNCIFLNAVISPFLSHPRDSGSHPAPCLDPRSLPSSPPSASGLSGRHRPSRFRRQAYARTSLYVHPVPRRYGC